MQRSHFLGPVSVANNSQRVNNPIETGQAQLKLTQQTQTVNAKWTKGIRKLHLDPTIKKSDNTFGVASMAVYDIEAGDILFSLKGGPNSTGLQEVYSCVNGLPTLSSSEEFLESIIVMGVAVDRLIADDIPENSCHILSVYVGGTISMYNIRPISPGYDVRVTIPFYQIGEVPPDQRWVSDNCNSKGAVKLSLEPIVANPQKSLSPLLIYRAINDKKVRGGSYKHRSDLSKKEKFTNKNERLRLATEGPMFKGFFSLLAPLLYNGSVSINSNSRVLCEYLREFTSMYHRADKKANEQRAKDIHNAVMGMRLKNSDRTILKESMDSVMSGKDKINGFNHIYSYLDQYDNNGGVMNCFEGSNTIFDKDVDLIDLIKKTVEEKNSNKKSIEKIKREMAVLAQELGFTDQQDPHLLKQLAQAKEIFSMNQHGSISPIAFGSNESHTKELAAIMKNGMDDWLKPMSILMNSHKSRKIGRVVEVQGTQVYVVNINMAGSNE